ncbi:MAG: hypothetical protein D6739_08025, partial [Nitrospirae bacterium]
MRHPAARLILVALTLSLAGCASTGRRPAEDPFAEYVWPPPPDTPRIRLETILTGRADVEGESRFRKALIGAGPQSPFDRLRKPYG